MLKETKTYTNLDYNVQNLVGTLKTIFMTRRATHIYSSRGRVNRLFASSLSQSKNVVAVDFLYFCSLGHALVS